jgi:asparagine synthase (glutamine-hydrolysing)
MSALAAIHVGGGTPNTALVSAMLAATPYRGRERIVEKMGCVALGCARDPEWVRASHFRTHRHLTALVGRLDNAHELILALGQVAVSDIGVNNDAALVAAVFEKWGPAGVARLRGSFAGLITDGLSLWGFRDHFGLRPLFYYHQGNRFVVATEVKQVLLGAGISREPDLDYLHGMVFGGRWFDTAFKGVKRIPKRFVAHLEPSGEKLTLNEYWNPSAKVATARARFEDVLEGTRHHLETAVRRVLTGQDVISLSGGLDSPSVAAFAAKTPRQGEPVKAFTKVFPAFPSVDESAWTRMVAEFLGLELHELVADAGSLDDLDYWTQLLDGPVETVAIPQLAEAYRMARGLGARTVISGEHAENVFDKRMYVLDYLLSRGRIVAAAAAAGGARRVFRRPKWLASQLLHIFAPPSWLEAYYQRFPPPDDRVLPWIDYSHFRATDDFVPFHRRPPRERWLARETAWLTGPGIGFEADEVCASSIGVEMRRPFLDVDLLEYALSLPAEVKYPTLLRSKPLLREAMRGLIPDAIIDRKNKTFFNEYHLAKADYPTLRSLLICPRHRLEGIDYVMLGKRLEAETLSVRELQSARDLARIHCFLNQW